MAEAFGQQFIQRTLSDMTVRGVTQIMPEGDGLGQVLVQTKGTGQRARHLRHLEGVRQAGTIVISFRRKKNLGLEFQTAEGFAVDNPIPVSLVFRAQVTGDDGLIPAGSFGRTGRPGGEQGFFLLFLPFADSHRQTLLQLPFSMVKTHSNNYNTKVSIPALTRDMKPLK